MFCCIAHDGKQDHTDESLPKKNVSLLWGLWEVHLWRFPKMGPYCWWFRNPKQAPGMYSSPLWILGYLLHQVVNAGFQNNQQYQSSYNIIGRAPKKLHEYFGAKKKKLVKPIDFRLFMEMNHTSHLELSSKRTILLEVGGFRRFAEAIRIPKWIEIFQNVNPPEN